MDVCALDLRAPSAVPVHLRDRPIEPRRELCYSLPTMRLLFMSLFFSVAALAGCGSDCDPQHACNVSSDQPGLLCDGKAYVACGDMNRNETVACGAGREAVCASSGWTFQNVQ